MAKTGIKSVITKGQPKAKAKAKAKAEASPVTAEVAKGDISNFIGQCKTSGDPDRTVSVYAVHHSV